MKFIPNAVSLQVGRAVLQTRKHSPVLLFGAGIAGAITSTVLACKATLQLEEVLAKAEDDMNKVTYTKTEHPDKYDEKDASSDRKIIRVKTTVNILKLYGPAIGVGVLSIGLLTGSHVVLTKRNTAVMAAYGAVDRAFREYRDRVRTELGDDKDREFRYGAIEKEIVEEGEHGHEVKTVKRANPMTAKSMYAVLFDENNPNFVATPAYNSGFLTGQQNWANDRLHRNGYLLLNDVYDMLGFERTKAGCVVGWTFGKKGSGDGYVDFGIFPKGRKEVYDFFNGDEHAIWLDFNVDGVVFDKI